MKYLSYMKICVMKALRKPDIHKNVVYFISTTLPAFIWTSGKLHE